jgi:LPS-assembly lipoprotein
LASLLLLAVAPLFLAACGFHLRGTIEVPAALKETRIVGVAQFAPLTLELKKVLTNAGSKVLPAAAPASSTITISNELYDRRVLSVDAQGRVAEYALVYSFYFQVSDAGGTIMVPNQKIALTRDYRFDPDNVLAKDTEEAQIRSDMISFAVRQLMRRIDAALRNKS